MSTKKNKRTVITGIGVISPLGKTTRSFWSGLKNGKSAINKITNFKPRKGTGYPPLAAEVKNFNINKYMGKDRWEFFGRDTQFCLAAARKAMDDAKLQYPFSERQCNSIGISMGLYLGCINLHREFEKDMRRLGPKHVLPILFANTGPNVSASQMSIRFNIRGFNSSVTSTIASMQAVNLASSMINDHGYTYVLSGGTQELTNVEFFNLGYQGCLAGLNDKKKGSRGIPKPYDVNRNGMIPGEGSSVFVIENLSNAKKRNAKIYCELKGYNDNNSITQNRGKKISSGHDYMYDVMNDAVRDAGLKIDDIDMIMGSANSTIRTDRMEGLAIEKLVSSCRKKPYVTSIKANIGETFGAKGSLNIAAAIGCLERNFVPPILNLKRLDPKIRINAVKNNFIKTDIKNILVNSFGYNGLNSSLVIGKI